MLEVADNLDYAIAASSGEQQGSGVDKSGTDPLDNRTKAVDSAMLLKNLVEGVEATNRGLLKAFAQFGVVKVRSTSYTYDMLQSNSACTLMLNNLQYFISTEQLVRSLILLYTMLYFKCHAMIRNLTR